MRGEEGPCRWGLAAVAVGRRSISGSSLRRGLADVSAAKEARVVEELTVVVRRVNQRDRGQVARAPLRERVCGVGRDQGNSSRLRL